MVDLTTTVATMAQTKVARTRVDQPGNRLRSLAKEAKPTETTRDENEGAGDARGTLFFSPKTARLFEK